MSEDVSLYLEDVEIGREYSTASHEITAAEIAAFGDLTLDHHPLHTDAEYARSRGFAGVIAHGLHALSLMEGLKTGLRLYETTSIASLGWDKVRFVAPVVAGDVLHLWLRFDAKRRSRKRDRGVVTETLALVKADGSVVITAEHSSLLLARTEAAPEAE